MAKKNYDPEEEDLFDNEEENEDQEGDDIMDDQLSFGDDADDEYESEIDTEDEEEEIERRANYHSARTSSMCQRAGYCIKCEGDHSEPNGMCHCRCHDIA